MTLRIDDHSAPLQDEDLFWLAHAEPALAFGMAVERWWEQKTGSWSERVDHDRLAGILASDLHPRAFLLTRRSPDWPEDVSYGFFDSAVVDGQRVPVVGRFQQMLFDRPKRGVAFKRAFKIWHENLRAFVLENVLLRGYLVKPTAAQPDGQRPLAPFLRPFSLLTPPREHGLERGLISSQLYYCRSDDGRVAFLKEFVDKPHVTVHVYRPSRSLGGLGGLLDFRRRRSVRLIELGYDDAVHHDCRANGCVV